MNEQQSQYLQNYLEKVNTALESAQLKNEQLQNQYAKNSIFPQVDDKSIVEFMLNTARLLDKAFHLLSGHVIKQDVNGKEIWEDPKDDRLKIFSKYGVERIMNLLSFYISPEIILSIMDIDTINREIRDFGIEVSDLIANRYELFFHYPSPEDLFEKLKPHVDKENISEEELYYKCVEWSNDELRMKLANYPLIVLSLLAIVHANYRRALNGETLKSLRTITTISQNLTGLPQFPVSPEKKGGLRGLLKAKT